MYFTFFIIVQNVYLVISVLMIGALRSYFTCVCHVCIW